MGTVYEAIDQRVRAVVALKETSVGTSEDSRHAFEREAALLANLRHQSLPKVMDYFVEGSGEFLVMEHIAGHDLAQLLKARGGPFELHQVLRWADEILKVLEYLHSRTPPILHRDIKPSNIKVTGEGDIFLLDFGLAKGAAGQMTTLQTSRSVHGYTLSYAPLEQIVGRGTDQRSDLYSLGATLYTLLTGVFPVDAPTRYSHIEDEDPDPLQPIAELNELVPSEVAAIIHQSMSVSRKNRPATATEIRLALHQAASEANKEEERRREAEERKKQEEAERQRLADETTRLAAQPRRQQEQGNKGQQEVLTQQRREEALQQGSINGGKSLNEVSPGQGQIEERHRPPKVEEASAHEGVARSSMGTSIDAICREKGIDREVVIEAVKEAVKAAARKQFKSGEDIQVEWTPEGGLEIFASKVIVEEVTNPGRELSLEEAKDLAGDEVEVGDELQLPLPMEDMGAIAAKTAKQILFQKVRDAERQNIYEQYIDKVGDLVNGYIKRFERGDIVVDIGTLEALLPRNQQPRGESWNQGERIRVVIDDVSKESKGPQVIVSRTSPELLKRLFEMEVPEIYDGTVVIKSAVREPGERAKIAVASTERDVDPVGACVGMKGSHVQAIIRELRGEKIDIIEWSDEPSAFAANALSPAKVNQVRITDIERRQMEVIVNEDQLSLAIGKRGQNVRLATKLVGWNIDIRSEGVPSN